MLNHIESDSLGEWAALSDCDDITLTNVLESRGDMDRHISVFLSETSVFWEVL